MVGVPGKSKGCSTCRRRKKGCDQKRPICGQCQNSGYICGGYERSLSFIIHPSSKAAQNAYYRPRRAQDASPFLMPSLDRSAIELQCKSLFWDLYLPHGVAEVQDNMLTVFNYPPNWTAIVVEFRHEEPALELAFSALSISRVGRSNHDIRLVKESSKVYGQALKALQKVLLDPSKAKSSEEILTACSILSLYEVFEAHDVIHSGLIGWVSHAQGAAQLLEMRGPRRHTVDQRQAHHIFLGARQPILYSAILRKKSTFLAREEWLTVPWAGTKKTYYEILIDTGLHIPALLERFEILRSSGNDVRQLLLNLLQDCHDLDARFARWNAKKMPRARPAQTRHERQSQDDDYPFDHEMTWQNHVFLDATLFYWSMRLIMCDTMTQIDLFLGSLGMPRPEMLVATAELQQHAYRYAECIAQSVPYCLMPDMGALGITHLNFPLCLAFEYFTRVNQKHICGWLATIRLRMREQGIWMRSPLEFAHGPGKQRFQRPNITSSHDRIEPDTGVALIHDRARSNSPAPSVPSTRRSDSPFATTFFYENPAKYYFDASDSPLLRAKSTE